MGGRLDVYVGRTVLASYGAGLLFLVVLFTSIDLLLNLGGYLEAATYRKAGALQLLGDLGHYYGLFLPIVFLMVAPFVSVIAGMFAVSSHMAVNEIVPMIFTGRSTRRVLRPVLGMGVVSALTMCLAWEFAIPRLVEPLNAAQSVLRGEAHSAAVRNMVVRGRGDVRKTLYVTRYDHQATRMSGVTVVETGDAPGDVSVVQAREAVWDPHVDDWRLIDGHRATASSTIPLDFLGMRDVVPDLLWRLGKQERGALQLSYSELLDLRALRPGDNGYVLGFHNHITFPIANLVLLLLALPFAVHFERGSRIERVMFAILVCGAYLVFDLICQNLGTSMLHPVLAAWLPTIVFGSIGVVAFAGIRT